MRSVPVLFAALFWEANAFAVTVTVDTSADTVNASDGVTSLREALLAAVSGDTINFGFGSQQTIAVSAGLGALPALPAGVTLDGQQFAIVDAGALASGAGLKVRQGATVKGMSVCDAPGACIEVTGDGATVGALSGAANVNYVWACGEAGILIDSAAGSVQIRNNVVGADPANNLAGACTSSTGACGGIQLRASGAGNVVDANHVIATQGIGSTGQGVGILVMKGSQVQVTNNRVGTTPAGVTVGSGNVGYGIAAGAAVGEVVPELLVQGNIVVGSGLSGILLSARTDGAAVEDNTVGLDLDLTVSGNGGDGIAIFASDDHNITDNVIVASTDNGIHLSGSSSGDWQSGTILSGNLVGLYDDGISWTAQANGGKGVLSEGQEGGLLLVGNTVSGNALSGIVLGDPSNTVRGNRVGTDPDGSTVLPNGAAGIALLGSSTVVGGYVDWSGLPSDLGDANLVAGNVDHGIVVGDGTERVRVVGNLVGTDGSGLGTNAAFGNGGAGVYVQGGTGHEIGGQHQLNVLVNNGTGIEVDGSFASSLIEILHNRVGRDLAGALIGNSGSGINVHDAVSSSRLAHNDVAGNASAGIQLDGTVSVELQQNSVQFNGECGYKFLNGANAIGGVPLVAPELTVGHLVVGGQVSGLTGTLTPPPAPFTVVSVEVFWDPSSGDGTEGSVFLGVAEVDLVKGTWTWEPDDGIPTPDPLAGRVSAIMTVGQVGVVPGFINVRSSDAGTFCGDGCAAVGTGACPMGNPCKSYECTASGECMNPVDVAGTCLDGDPCTVNDTCVAGGCQPGPVVSPCTACEDVDSIGRLQTLVCDDGDPCTKDRCALGVCLPPKEVTCDDGNDCSSDSCVAGVGCTYADRAAGFVCEDENLCTGVGTCDGLGNCSAAPEFGCPFEYCNGNRAVAWGCDPGDGCVVVDGWYGCDGLCDLWDLCPYDNAAGTGDSSCPDGESCLGCPTDCPNGDNDGDAIPDDWEISGIDLDCDGTLTLDEQTYSSATLLLDEATPNVLVQLDFMTGYTLDESPDGLQLVVDAFAFNNVDNTVLYVDQSRELTHHEAVTFMNAPSEATCTDWLPLNQTKLDPSQFEPWRWGIFHYAISGDHPLTCQDGSSGVGEVNGDDFIIAASPFGLPTDVIRKQRGTFMHELGHNLGLVHGGGTVEPKFTVNYQSVMSYRYQFPNLRRTLDDVIVPDYSYEKLLTLDETALDEQIGVHDPLLPDLGPDYYLRIEPNGTVALLHPSLTSLDWDQDGFIDLNPVSVDVSGDGIKTKFIGHKDWGNLNRLLTCNAKSWMLGVEDEALVDLELDEETAAAMRVLYPELIADVDVGPGCSANHVATDGTGKVQAVIFGSSELDVIDIDPSTVRVRQATVELSSIEDVDGDVVDDFLIQVETSALGGLGNGSALHVFAVQDDSQVVLGDALVTWVSTTTDADSDGVRDSCDLCPNQAAPAPDADGCP